MKNEQGLRGAKRLLVTQLFTILVMARFVTLFWGEQGVVSVLLGGFVCVLPSMGFAWVMFKSFKTAQIQQYLKRVYRGEAFKIALTLFFFALVFKCFHGIIPWLFLASFWVVQSTVWLTPWIFVTRECDQ